MMTEPWSLEQAARELAKEWFWPLDEVDVAMRITDFGREVERQTEMHVRAEVAGAEAELARLKGTLYQNNLRGMLLHLLDAKQWARISRPRGTAEKGFDSFTREDVHDILRVLREVAPKEQP